MPLLSPTAVADALPEARGSSLDAALRGRAFTTLTRTGWIRVMGEDRVRWLNGMTTNAVAACEPGEGCYTFFLSAQGRIQGDAVAFRDPSAEASALLLETAQARIPALMALLDRFIIMDDVVLAELGHTAAGDRPAEDARAGLALAGPETAAALAALGFEPMPEQRLRLDHTLWRGHAVDLVHAHSPLVPRFELWAQQAVISELASALGAAGATEADAFVFEQLRVLEGTPLYGSDIGERDLPQETGQTRALHFSKGCYLGQEIVERIHSRGNVHRTFTGFRLNGELPAVGSRIAAADAPEKPLGELTSVATIGSLNIALGYIRREALDRGEPLLYPGGSAIVSSLPFQLPVA